MKAIFYMFVLVGWMLSGTATGQECEQTIEGNNLLQFNLPKIRVSASCEQVKITLQHTGTLPANVMGHNWVLTTTANYMLVVVPANRARPPGSLPKSDPRVIANTDLIGGGESSSVTFDLSGLEPGGDYTYFCSFPGHYVLMKGKFIIE